MEPFIRITGVVAALDRENVDTDQIIPAVYLKRIERTGFGEFLFSQPGWRFLPDGQLDPNFELNRVGYEGASILIAGKNFGSGSSREHAPWALLDYGFKVIIAPSFADIFHNNCFQNGMLPVVLPEDTVREIMDKAVTQPGYQLTVDLDGLSVSDDQGFNVSFATNEFRRDCLLKGLDDIGLTLQLESKIDAFEQGRS
ncbi:MAG: 3-isopropylmalate dehydratase small subunit [Chloroflexi bacterium]|nr:3-isopropylmalate dehydratase small subunit [Chloroflexota bacterium]|tara:strand:- start:30717 stop:31310 length:594 start_codon:yes stop_codon:yes gene_type:complete